ncbi:hypothetical protein L1987_06225 [Smallanthus sonchifolius]|uniref:Uncharacterized protein n=1 Tax=Smallanthus sonchifolius TaxID=185202 RepID=A0ACB9JXK4_9ASTR|nr:hypothetical protein L1987_06225 [Smallanthus sonchifolius]
MNDIGHKHQKPPFFACQTPASERRYRKKQFTHPQNTDLPPILHKNKKKTLSYPSKEDLASFEGRQKACRNGLVEPPKNGLLVPDLVPVAYEVLDAWKILIKGTSSCDSRPCLQVHVGQTGHDIQNCHGPNQTVQTVEASTYG